MTPIGRLSRLRRTMAGTLAQLDVCARELRDHGLDDDAAACLCSYDALEARFLDAPARVSRTRRDLPALGAGRLLFAIVDEVE